ncbi:MAG: hypothetical protein P1U30_05965 [Phycisphaerales bacterium]|nr:hypothetical protein [Phycisphaerales bacterium]
MSTPMHELNFEDAFAFVKPKQLRTKLTERYLGVKSAFLDGEYDACGVRAGRFSEIVIRVLQQELTGTHSKLGDSKFDFNTGCNQLMNTPKSTGPDSLRIIIPRCIGFLYTIRNKRGFGHESDELDADIIDSAVCAKLSDWVMCELMRYGNSLPLEDGQAILDALAYRETPMVWSVQGRKRVLDASMPAKDQVLLLLYGSVDSGVPTEDLCQSIEYSSLRDFRRYVLKPLHEKRLLEYDRDQEMVILSPTGAAYVDGVSWDKAHLQTV